MPLKHKYKSRMLPNGRSANSGAHVRLQHWVLTSRAYRWLEPNGRALLVELYALYNGKNNGSIALSVREAAARLAVSCNSVLLPFQDLQEFGFIRPKIKGAFSVKNRRATTWILTEFDHGHETATKDFMGWKPLVEIHNTVVKTETNSCKKKQPLACPEPPIEG